MALSTSIFIKNNILSEKRPLNRWVKVQGYHESWLIDCHFCLEQDNKNNQLIRYSKTCSSRYHRWFHHKIKGQFEFYCNLLYDSHDIIVMLYWLLSLDQLIFNFLEGLSQVEYNSLCTWSKEELLSFMTDLSPCSLKIYNLSHNILESSLLGTIEFIHEFFFHFTEQVIEKETWIHSKEKESGLKISNSLGFWR